MRWAFFSDLHYNSNCPIIDSNGNQYSYGETDGQRLHCLVELLNKEHAKSQFSAAFCLGDLAHDGKNNLQEALQTIRNNIKFPLYLIPGNHDNLSDSDWYHEVGSPRSFHLYNNGVHFFCLDTFSDSENRHHYSGLSNSTDLLKQMNPGNLNVVCAHWLKKEDISSFPIVPNCILVGHSHIRSIVSYSGQFLINTGNFSYGLKMQDCDDWISRFGWGITSLVLSDGVFSVQPILYQYKYDTSLFRNGNMLNEPILRNYSI